MKPEQQPTVSGDYLLQIEMNNEKPYLETIVPASIEYHYNPKYGDNRKCICGHPYYRHFDTYEDMANIGCKYCQCEGFKEVGEMEQRAIENVPVVSNESANTVDEVAESWANKFYKKDSDSVSGITEHDQWENRKHNFIEGVNWQKQQSEEREKELLGVIGELNNSLVKLYDFTLNSKSSLGLPLDIILNNAESALKEAKQYIK